MIDGCEETGREMFDYLISQYMKMDLAEQMLVFTCYQSVVKDARKKARKQRCKQVVAALRFVNLMMPAALQTVLDGAKERVESN